MMKILFSFLTFLVTINTSVLAQKALPDITVKNISGKIIISWLNDYKKPVANILIQRSYDSLKNYSTIGTVLNPLNLENGYPDVNPPYNKMYYRVYISFEGGSYVIGPAVRPVKVIPASIPVSIDTSSSSNPAPIQQPESNTRFPWQYNQSVDSSLLSIPKKENEITYPSARIFTGRQNNVVIHLPQAGMKKYSVKFFDEEDKLLFELTRLNEEYLIIEKVNFVHTGWFHFELYEEGKLIEKNKFYIGKEGKESRNNNK
jgi:hypothetical protein